MLKDEDILNIRETYLQGFPQTMLANKYNVSQKTIYRIVNLLSHTKEETIPKYYKHRLIVRKKHFKRSKARQQILLIGYQKRQGKDTFAKLLQEELAKRNIHSQIKSFAYPLKTIVADMLQLSLEELEELKNSEETININGKLLTYRDLLINFGNGKVKQYLGKSVWRDLLLKSVNRKQVIIVPDFRFPEEYIEEAITIKVEREFNPNAELDLHNFDFDYTINNNGSIEDLRGKAVELIESIFESE